MNCGPRAWKDRARCGANSSRVFGAVAPSDRWRGARSVTGAVLRPGTPSPRDGSWTLRVPGTRRAIRLSTRSGDGSWMHRATGTHRATRLSTRLADGLGVPVTRTRFVVTTATSTRTRPDVATDTNSGRRGAERTIQAVISTENGNCQPYRNRDLQLKRAVMLFFHRFEILTFSLSHAFVELFYGTCVNSLMRVHSYIFYILRRSPLHVCMVTVIQRKTNSFLTFHVLCMDALKSLRFSFKNNFFRSLIFITV